MGQNQGVKFQGIRIPRLLQFSVPVLAVLILAITFTLIGLEGLYPKIFEGLYPSTLDEGLESGMNELIIGTADGKLFYLNTTAPDTSILYVFSEINFGFPVFPSPVDWNNDSKVDVLLGLDNGSILFFDDFWNESLPSAVFVEESPLILDAGHNPAPTCADWNGDGALDVIIGFRNGTLALFLNNGTSPIPNLIKPIFLSVDSTTIDVGESAHPVVTDLTNDSLPDLIIGNKDGHIFFFENAGNLTHADLEEPISLLSASLYPGASPAVVDWDGDGLLDIVFGTESGELFKVINQGTSTSPSFVTPTRISAASNLTPEQLTPIPEAEGLQLLAALANAAVYILIALVGGFFILVLIRSGKFRAITVIFSAILGLACFTLGYFFFAAFGILIFNNFIGQFITLPQMVIQSIFELTILFAALLFAGLGILSAGLGFLGKPVRNIMLIIFGAMFGAILGIHFPLWSTTLILIGLSLYDIFAVFRGPIKGILDAGDEHLGIPASETGINDSSIESSDIDVEKQPEDYSITEPRQSFEQEGEIIEQQLQTPQFERVSILSLSPALPIYSWGEISIGLGDFAFYSLLVSHAFFQGLRVIDSFLPVLLATFGVLIGSIITYKILERGNRALPGLPIPIGLGLAGMILGGFLGTFLPL